jgi:hypothetical protein
MLGLQARTLFFLDPCWSFVLVVSFSSTPIVIRSRRRAILPHAVVAKIIAIAMGADKGKMTKKIILKFSIQSKFYQSRWKVNIRYDSRVLIGVNEQFYYSN